MKANALAWAVLFAEALVCLGGCSGPEIQFRNPGGIARTPEGRMAVLKVTARPLGKPLSLDVFWGIVRAPDAPAAFAELLAHFAREDGGLDVAPPAQVTEALEDAGLEPTLDPSPEALDAFVDALGCASYLTARVETWHHKYVLFWPRATIRFVVSCHVPGDQQPLWSVRVDRVRGAASYRRVAISALKDMFRSIRRQRAVSPQ